VTSKPQPKTQRGRGITSNPTGRFEARRQNAFDDGWGTIEEPPPRVRTTVTNERTREPITTNDSPDVPFDRSINPYKGCEHGCSYCFARTTHAYLGLSPGLDFETRIFAKPDLPEALRRRFASRGYVPQVIALGANTDPYQPVERELRISRRILEIMLEFRHPVALITKSQMVLRDLDLLSELAANGLAEVMLSLTTLDAKLARAMEPRATSPAGRLETMRRLAQANVPVGVLSSPMIPGLNDHELERILESSAEAGAKIAGYILLRLPLELAELFEQWLREHAPLRAERVLSLMRQIRGGDLYRADFQTRMVGEGPIAKLLARRFELSCGRLGLNERRHQLRTDLFRRPCPPGENLDLFSD
jgi:DNA repair photolyase